MNLPSHWIGCIGLLVAVQFTTLAQPPPAPKKPVTDVYNGVAVTDNYRWLENYSDPAARAWSDAQNKYARKYLDSLPIRATLFEQLKRLYSEPSARYSELI